MKKLTLTIFIFCIGIIGNLNSQNEMQVSPDGIFDTIQDSHGHRFHISNASLASTKVIGSGGLTTIASVPTQSCQAGKFILYFAPNSLLANSTPAQTVICQVFQDISGWVNSPASISTNPIHILCNNTASVGIANAGSIFLYPNFP